MAARTPTWAIGAVIVCTLLMVGAQVLLKTGIRDGSPGAIGTGVALLIIGGFLLTIALKHGELSVLHPVLSLSFVWVLLASGMLGEPLGWQQYTGVLVIVTGVSLIGRAR